jgi:hypothetical protein
VYSVMTIEGLGIGRWMASGQDWQIDSQADRDT